MPAIGCASPPPSTRPSPNSNGTCSTAPAPPPRTPTPTWSTCTHPAPTNRHRRWSCSPRPPPTRPPGSLWPDVRRSSARGRFHTTISELRQTLHEAIAADAIIRTGDRYRLDPTHADVDLWRLNQAVDHAATTVDPDTHHQALRDIIAGYTGHLADGHSWLWLAAHREAARRHVLDAYTSLAETEPDPRHALALIQQAIRLDPYSEDLYRRAMHLHAALHSADGVHRALRAITEHLAQVDIEPSPETTRLAAELLTKLDARRRQGHAA